MLGLILLLQSLIVAVAGPPSSPEYLPIRVADAYGYFAKERVAVTIKSTRAESGAAEALAQGQADLAATSLEAMFRFGYRAQSPRIVFALTAAPPTPLLVSTAHAGVTSVKDLERGKIAFVTPGSPEQIWLLALLAKSGIRATGVELLSLGPRGVVTALDSGDAMAAFVSEPAASGLVKDGRARLLIDLKSPPAIADALGAPTVHAAVFMRGDRRPKDRDLAAFARAILEAQQLIATGNAAELAERLPRSVATPDEEFVRRVEAMQGIYLPGGIVTTDALAHTIDIVRTHVPLPRLLKIPKPQDMLYLEPTRRALKARPPA